MPPSAPSLSSQCKSGAFSHRYERGGSGRSIPPFSLDWRKLVAQSDRYPCKIQSSCHAPSLWLLVRKVWHRWKTILAAILRLVTELSSNFDTLADWLGRNESRVVSSEGPRRYVSSICWTKIGRRLASVEMRSMCKGCAALELIRKIGCERLFAFDRLGRKLKGSFRAFVKEYLINLSKEMHYIEKRIRSFSRTILLDMLINSVTWWKMAHQDGIFVEDGISSHNSQRTFPIKLTLTNLRMSVLQPFPSLSLSPPFVSLSLSTPFHKSEKRCALTIQRTPPCPPFPGRKRRKEKRRKEKRQVPIHRASGRQVFVA